MQLFLDKIEVIEYLLYLGDCFSLWYSMHDYEWSQISLAFGLDLIQLFRALKLFTEQIIQLQTENLISID